MRSKISVFLLKTAILTFIAGFCAIPASGQSVLFTQVAAAESGTFAEMTGREATRIERFLGRVFPTRQMRHIAHSSDRPIVRRVTYGMINQSGQHFLIAGFTGRWKDAYNIMAIYRMENGWPTQIWRSNAWQASYYGWRFSSVEAGPKTLLLMQEGADENSFGLASVISFQNVKKGLIIHDLTPSLPRLRAYTSFPFRPLYGQSISLRFHDDEKPSIILRASDEEFQLSSTHAVRPTTEWRYNKQRSRFERIGVEKSKGALTHILDQSHDLPSR